jgi:hypothetical protein
MLRLVPVTPPSGDCDGSVPEACGKEKEWGRDRIAELR